MPDIELDTVFHTPVVDEVAQVELLDRFNHAARWVAERFGSQRLTVSISIVDDATIQRLNAAHLQHDWPTDVISFVFESGANINGEIIASWETAHRLCGLAGWTAGDELVLYIVHGLLHLVGMDDEDPMGQAAMRLEESEYLRAAGVPGAEAYILRFDDICG